MHDDRVQTKTTNSLRRQPQTYCCTCLDYWMNDGHYIYLVHDKSHIYMCTCDIVVDIVWYPGTVAKGCVVDVSRDGDTCEKVAWKTRSASVLWRRYRRYWTLVLRWPTHTDKPQSMQELRRRLLPRDDQEGYDAMTIRKDPHERVSYSARQTENPTDVIPPHNSALHTNRHI